MIPTIDTSAAADAYSKAFRRLRELTGFDHRIVLRAEMGSILKTWAGRTKVGNTKIAVFRARARAIRNAIGRNAAGRNGIDVSVNSGRRGGFPGEVWFRTSNQRFQQAGVASDSGQFTPAWKHWKKDDWELSIKYAGDRAAAEFNRLVPLAPKSVGLARQSVIQIADALGIDLANVAGGGVSSAGIAKARAAVASTGRRYQNGAGSQGGDGIKSYIEGICRLPYGSKIGMDRDLAFVLAGRAKYIATSYAKGVFDSNKNVERAFPNLIRVSSDGVLADSFAA